MAFSVLLFTTFAGGQQSSSAAPERVKIAPDIAVKMLCGSSTASTTSAAANRRTEDNSRPGDSMCGGPVPTPSYPAAAKQQGIQGTVNLTAVIGKDGTIQSLKLIDGHPLLVPAAIEAVSKWRYKPFLLNHKPVEVETTISVNFTLSGASTQAH